MFYFDIDIFRPKCDINTPLTIHFYTKLFLNDLGGSRMAKILKSSDHLKNGTISKSSMRAF
jgi:hypothetical protein